MRRLWVKDFESKVLNSPMLLFQLPSFVFLRSVEIHRYIWIRDENVQNLRLICVLDVARCQCLWCAQECFDHLARCDVRMSMLASEFRNNRPSLLRTRMQKCLAKQF